MVKRVLVLCFHGKQNAFALSTRPCRVSLDLYFSSEVPTLLIVKSKLVNNTFDPSSSFSDPVRRKHSLFIGSIGSLDIVCKSSFDLIRSLLAAHSLFKRFLDSILVYTSCVVSVIVLDRGLRS